MEEKQDVVLNSSSRAQALKTGALVDGSAAADKVGFNVPVALTVSAWHHCIAAEPSDESQNEESRLLHVLGTLDFVLCSMPQPIPHLFEFGIRGGPVNKRFALKAELGHDDDGAKSEGDDAASRHLVVGQRRSVFANFQDVRASKNDVRAPTQCAEAAQWTAGCQRAPVLQDDRTRNVGVGDQRGVGGNDYL